MDEADRLLEGNFDEQVKINDSHTNKFIISFGFYLETQLQTIFQALPEKRQTLLFSATITDTLNKLREVALNDV